MRPQMLPRLQLEPPRFLHVDYFYEVKEIPPFVLAF